VSSAALVAALATFALGGCKSDGAGAPRVAVAPHPSILLISIDTTRADRLGCYGEPGGPTPNLDRWAAAGVLFQNAVTPVPITLPAHTSLLTGLLPRHHGVRDNGIYRVPEDVPTLASILRQAGYETAAVVGSAILDREYGLARGFQRYDDAVGGGGLAIAERDASAVSDAAISVARSLHPPFFLFVHYFDPHAAYEPPAPFAERFRDDPYEGEIAYVDEQIGRLRDALVGLGLLEGTIVAVVSDHGESLGEHGEPTHGVFLYQATLHVPMIVVAPATWPVGRRVATLASLTDVAPTLLELSGQKVPAGLDGRSLAPAVWNRAVSERWLPLESEFGYDSYGWARLVGLTDGSWKWVGAPEPELYDLTHDPHERRNLAGDRGREAEKLAALWRKTAGRDRRSLPVKDESDQARSERLERLAALGYTEAARRPETGALRPDPKRVIGTLESINEARRLLGERRFPEADKLLESVIRGSPRNLSALVLLGSSRILEGQPAAAVEPLRRAAELAPYNSDVQFNLGLAWSSRGDASRAERAWRRTLALAPRYEDAAVNLVNLLMQVGRSAEAEQALKDARQAGLAGPLLDFLEGKQAAQRGDAPTARAALTRALSGSLAPSVAAEARRILGSLPAPR
jgi:arylsulfatase A-like enzyme/thioredoxin-like negative regulator of GroEL